MFDELIELYELIKYYLSLCLSQALLLQSSGECYLVIAVCFTFTFKCSMLWLHYVLFVFLFI